MKRITELLGLRNIGFEKKLWRIYLLFVVLPITIISCFYSFLTIRTVKNNNMAEIEFDTATVAENVERILDEVLMVSDICYYDTNLLSCLKMREGNVSNFMANAKNIDRIVNYSVVYDSISSIKIYTFNDNLYNSNVVCQASMLGDSTFWYNEFLKQNNNCVILGYYDESYKQWTVSVIRRLDTYGWTQDILKIDISYVKLANALSYNLEKGSMYLLDENNICILSSDYENNGAPDEKMKVRIDGIFKELSIPAGYKIYCKHNPWYIKNLSQDSFVFLAVLLGVLSLSIFLGYNVIHAMIEKLKMLTRSIVKTQNGIFEKIDDKNIDNDEVGALVTGYNAAVDKIDNLINEVYQKKLTIMEYEKEKNKAEYIALVNQINPHFIFNSLEMLRMHSIKRGDREFDGIIRNMAILFRKLISWKQDIITFEEEMSFVDAFIQVSRFNMDNKVSIKTEIDDKIRKCYLPKMTAQIFVENAFRHGLENILSKREFYMEAKYEDDKLVIRVRDNGVGIDKDFVDVINSGNIENIKEKGGIGIANVFSRLKLCFDDFSVKVESIPLEKTEFTIKLPIKYDV